MNYVPGSSVMPFDGPSRISKVSSTIGHTIDDSSNSISSTFFDKFFLIIDELGRCSPPNSVLVFIQLFISLYQYYITMYMAYLPENWNLFFFPDKILRYLMYPIDFGLGDRYIFDTKIVSYIILILSGVIIIYLSTIFIYYQINKLFPRYNTHIMRFILSFLIPIILPPISYNIGFSFNLSFNDKSEIIVSDTNSTGYNDTNIYYQGDLFNQFSIDSVHNHTSLYIIFTVLGMIFYICLVMLFYIDIMFRSSTPFIEETPLSMWDGFPLFLCVFGSSITILFSRIISRLPNWSKCILIVCCILYNSFILYKMFFFPMVKHCVNVTISIVICSGMIASFFQLLPIPSIYRMAVPFGCFIILIPVFIFVFRFLRRKTVLKEIDGVKLTNENHAIRYLRLIIADKCSEFVKFKWIKPMNRVSTTRLLCQMSQIISFFPFESQNLALFISLLSKNHKLALHQRFLFFQLRRVHVLRQSNTSKQLNDDLAFIARATNQSISSFSQFLMRTVDERQTLSIDRLRYLSKLNQSTSSLCHEAMSRYPNSSRLMFIFSRYVIECQADFKGGVMLYQEGKQIECGKRATVDYAFRSMANLFPSYLLKRILDYKGKSIIGRKKTKSGSSLSNDSTSNDRNSQLDDTDLESNDKISSSVLDNPRLRFSLKKSVNQMKSIGISILSLSSVLRFLLSLIICIVIIVVASNFLSERRINYKNIAQIGKVRKSLDLSLFRMAKLWSLNLSLSPKEKDIESSLGPNVSLNDYHNFSVGPEIALFNDVIDSIHAIEELGKLLIEIKYDDRMAINDKSTTDFVQLSNISFCDRKAKTVIKSTTSIRYFSLYLLNHALYSTKLGKIYNHPSEWKEDECICEVILNMHNVIDALNDQSTVLISQEEELSKTMRKQIIIFFCICIPIVFAVYIIPFIVGFIKMNLEFQQIFDVLNLLPIKIYKEASKPIALFSIDNEQSQDVITQAEHKGCQKIAILLPWIISSIIIVGSLFGVCFLILDVNNKFYALVKWLEISSGRTPLLIETITNAIYAGIYGYLGDTDYTTLVYHLQSVFNYSQELLYQHKTLIWGSNYSTSCNNFSSRLDSLHFTNTCAINLQGNSFQNSYRCMSLDQQIMTFNKFAKDVYLTLIYAQYNNYSTDNGNDDVNLAFLNILNGFEAINLHYLGITFLLPGLEAAQEILDEGINLKIQQLREYSLVIALCTLTVEFILFLIDLAIVNNLNDEFNIVRVLIARLPPFSISQTQSLVELITGKIDNKEAMKMAPIITNVQTYPNSIIAFDKQCQIQLINSATSKVFGFTKEQLFHANLSTLINEDDYLIIQDKVNRNIESKKRKDLSNQEEVIRNLVEDDKTNQILSTLLTNENNSNIILNENKIKKVSTEKVDLFNEPFHMTFVGLKDDGAKMIISAILTYIPEPDNVYALIMKDKTKVYINKEDIKRAKKEAENIINQVLPRAMSQNGQMNENVSFSIKQATVINIKILNFNDSIPHITSVQAIRNMTELYSLFDSQLISYPNLTKTSIISDSYQAVGGLFDVNAIRKISSLVDDSESQTLDQKNIAGNEMPNENLIHDINDEKINNNDSNNNHSINNSDSSNDEHENNNEYDSNSNSNSNSTNDVASDLSKNSKGIEENGSRVSIISSQPSESQKLGRLKVRKVISRKSIYDIKSLNPDQSVIFANIILDSVYFALNCISATEYANASLGTNYVLGIGISSGGPITAGTLGKQHIQFEIVGGALKDSINLSNMAEDGMIVIDEETYRIVNDSFEAQKNLVFQKYKSSDKMHSKKTETYTVMPSEILCPRVNDSAYNSPHQSARDVNDDDTYGNEQLQMEEDLGEIQNADIPL